MSCWAKWACASVFDPQLDLLLPHELLHELIAVSFRLKKCAADRAKAPAIPVAISIL
jgi:hypothetical protein